MSLFPPLPSSASSKSSGVSEWSKVSTGESKGVSTKATLFVGQESITYCLSCVGSTGLVVCCKPRGEQAESCGTKHNGERFEFPAGRTLQDLVFIHDPKNKTRFLSEPWADRKWFSEAALKVMSSDYKSVPEWSEVFRVAQIQAYEDLQPASVASIQSSLEFVANAQELKTPGRKAPKKDDPIIKDIPKSPFLTEQDITLRNEWYNNELLPKGLVAHVEKLGDAMNEVMERMDSQEGEDKNLFLDVVDDLMKIKVWQERTEASIGNSLPLFGREFPNLWSALDYSVRQEEESTIKQIVDLQELVFELKDREDASNKELQSFLGDVSQSFENVKAHLGDMTAELNALKMAQSRQASSGATTPGSRARIQNGVLFPPLTPSNPSKPLGKDEADDTLKIVVELRKRITKLEGSRISGSGSGGDGPPHFGGLGLTCIEDLASWNMERGLGHYFGLFQDANSLLTFKRSEFVDSHEHMATLKRARDVGLNLIQAKLLVSFQNQVPLFFGKGSPNKTSALNALPTARDWEEDDGTSGAKHDLDRALPSINKQLQSYIDVYLGEDQHEARALANRCLSQSLLFIHKLSDFITRSYRTMMLLKYDAVKSWTFLMRQVKRIWEDIGRARACCVDLGSPTDLEEVGGGVFQNHNAALAMWGVLKAHDVMNDYLRHNFEDHPSIAAEQVRWVTRNVMGGDKQSSDSDVKTLEGRISKGEKAVAALKTSLDKITTRVDTVEKKNRLRTIRSLEAVGRLPIYRSGLPCIVIGDTWPAWLPVVPALGARVSAVICNVKSKWVSDLNGTGTPWLGVGTDGAARFVTQSPKDTLIFVSGSAKFVLSLEHILKDKERIVVALDLGNRVSAGLRRVFPNLLWQRIPHEDVGGVTACRNWIGSTPGIYLSQMELSPYRRSIGEVLKPALKGRFGRDRDPPRSIDQNADDSWGVIIESPGLVSPYGLWPACSGGLKIVAPSVFASSGWVHRPLAPMELGTAWDLPVDTLKFINQLRDYPEQVAETLHFISRTPPCKSLWTFGQSMVMFGLQQTDLTDNPFWVDDDSDADTVKTNNVQGFGISEDSLELEARKTGSESKEAREAREAKATKEDDAATPVHLWNERVLVDWNERPDQDDAGLKLDVIRTKLLLRRWKQNLRRSLVTYLRGRYGAGWLLESPRSSELQLDLEAATDAMRRAMDTTWWNWDSGSALFFWRWPEEFRLEARDGTPIRISGELPQNRHPQSIERVQFMHDKMTLKIENVREKGYIAPGRVASLTGFFAVPKGESDIRMVYDATASGLNDALWAPSFGLPTVDATLRSIGFDTYLGDLDLGEMFLNFKLHHQIRPYAGVDVSAYLRKDGATVPPDPDTVCWERWERCLMGFKPSPYNATRAFAWAEDIIRGDPSDETNPLHWSHIRLNLPGEDMYDPTLPWLSKVITRENLDFIAGDFASYIDDIRTSGVGEDECWLVSRRVASYCGFLGIQDAPRKRRSPSQTPGSWAGSNVVVQPNGVSVTVSKEKWKKTQGLILKWSERVAKDGSVNYKEFESDLGYLIYVTRTFPSMQPYLKGFHLTLHGWRPDRGEDGWKMASLKMECEREDWPGDKHYKEKLGDNVDTHPSKVKAVPRLRDDLLALASLTSSEAPPLRLVRPCKVRSVRYGFGDASGSGFGSTFSVAGAILYRHGIWGDDGANKSSNWRELTNLVETLELEAMEGRLQGCEVFVFTDNSTAEAAFFKGTSSSPLLFDLVLRLRKLEVEQQCLLHVVHVAGTRMIGQGSDGLSRGNLTEGVMLGRSMTSYVPLSATALERSPALENWFRSWAGPGLEVLTTRDWFGRGQGIEGYTPALGNSNLIMPCFKTGTFLWHPAPAVASIAIEELRRSRHKRENSTHIFACPRLMTNRWRKLVLKEADFVFEVPVGTAGVWETDMHEPLLIAICLPFIEHSPWKIGGTPRVLAMDRKMRRVWKDPTGDSRLILRELLKLPRRLSGVSSELVRRVLYSAGGR